MALNPEWGELCIKRVRAPMVPLFPLQFRDGYFFTKLCLMVM